MKTTVLLSYGWLLALLFLAAPKAKAQVPAWQMLASTHQINTTNGNPYVQTTTLDANGNVLVTGRFTDTITLGTITLTSAGGADGFVAKWNPVTESWLWAYRMGGSLYDEVSAVTVSGANVYIGGSFASQTASFGALSLTNISTDCIQYEPSDIFVTKLVDAGNSASFAWVQQAQGIFDERISGLAVSGNQIYLMGGMSSTGGYYGPGGNTCSSFNRVTFGANTLVNIGPGQLGFVAKLVDAGHSAGFAWASTVGGVYRTEMNALVVNGTSVYVAGNFRGDDLYFGAPVRGRHILQNTSGGSTGNIDGFLLKLVDAGSSIGLVWAQQVGGAYTDESVTQLAVNASDIYMIGTFHGTAEWGRIRLTTPNIFGDGFLAKLTDEGSSSTFAWVRQGGGNNGQRLYTDLAISGDNVYVAGTLTSATSDFDGTTLTNPAFGTPNPNALFVAKTQGAGTATFSWAKGVSGLGYSTVIGLAVNGNRVFLTGEASKTVTFGSLAFAGPANGSVGFVASFVDQTITAAVPSAVLQRIALFPNPAHGRATVQFPALAGASTATLTVLDALGRSVRTQTATPSITGLRHELDLTGLPAGIYAVQVEAGGITTTQRLVVE
ncbi:T9SS type A sorting domain-containing protein [Hymenobacter sp. BT683]|uniref:T9SS type A sorting domain-containing protein n=1 Tax=Hymenobacter jeongseonensis TaxID=2791027 RepID=A0ABS0ILR4_9BACT|nr:T9SS type A sorting domain-containing protein [Hymenobacter jeongseonensis]MBF9238715.1 T9SS type A sorting domain-containing protein [Hymenobacter jeongseonensis]